MTLDTHAVPVAPARPADRGAPLSPAQQAALLPERLAGVAAANVFAALEFPASLVRDVAECAAALCAAHEILRTVYPDDRRVPYQRVLDTAPVVETVELAAAALPGALMSDAGHRFDLTTQPPLRIRLYRLPDRAVVSIAAHPVAADDHTLDLIAARVFEAVSAEESENAPQYRDFAPGQVKQLAAEDASLAFWKQRLAGLPEQLLPLRERPSTPRSARAVVRVPAAPLAELAAGESAATATLAALVADTLRGLGAPADVPLGVGVPGRFDGSADILGNFANYLVLREDSPRGGTPRQLIGAAEKLLAEAHAHAGTRIERLTQQLRGPGGAAKGGLFQVLLRVRPSVLEFAVAGGIAREIASAAARPHGVDLIVDSVTTADGWTVTVEVTEDLSRRYSAGQFAARLQRTAESWTAALDTATDASAVSPCEWFTPDDDLALDPLAISGLGGAPQTPAEQVVAEVLREILELDADDEIGREDNFFALGGDSVAALRFVTLLAERGHHLDVQQIFESPTVREMAATLTTADTAAPPAPAPEVAPLAASGLDADALRALAGKLAAR
ncbi:thioester reductase [Nocardia yunnanensis]|uniref:Thioester reductase n=1 Tax=Nocardia yunnanensis TaxID=2382165 RepID=A0A386ZHX7_9NOCA|nr:condensation domain-containing protein [Nocardia yunnanensis]AYF77121.1 thioester reductase [Nocardia yunnanensis]